MTKTIAYKAFNSDMTCRGFQYEVGETYHHEGDISLCSAGFHACTYPLDCFSYYQPAGSRFAVVEISDALKAADDTKIVGPSIFIVKEITLAEMIDAAVKATLSTARGGKKNHATGDRGAASATGDRGAASATGNWGAASATGDRGAASATGNWGAASATGNWGAAFATGNWGAAFATGYQGAASAGGIAGSAHATGEGGRVMGEIDGISLFCREIKFNGEDFEVVSVACGITGRDGVKAGVWYSCKDGKLVEADQ